MRQLMTGFIGGLAAAGALAGGLAAADASAAMVGDVQSWKQDGAAVTLACGGPIVRLAFWAEDVVRVTLAPDDKHKPVSTQGVPLVLQGCYGEAPAIKVSDGDAVTIETKRLVVRVDKKPFRLSFLRQDGTTLIARSPADRTLDTERAAYFEADASGGREHLFGGGEKARDSCDLRGRTFVCDDRPGGGAPAPYVMSTAGYGLFVNSVFGGQVEFDLRGDGKPFSISVGNRRGNASSRADAGTDEALDFFFLYGPGFEHLIDRLTTLTGKPPMFPKPIFGLSYHTRVGPDQQGPGQFTRFRKEGYPMDGCITFINRSWNEKSDPYVRQTAQEIHDRHGWVVGYLDSTDSYVGFLMDTDFPYRRWNYYRENLSDRLFRQGVDSIFMDELERRGALFGLHVLAATYEAMSKAYPGRRAVVLSRSGYTGCQRYCYWWMGDTGPHARSARGVVRAQLGHGLAGMPHTTHDLGGYFGPGNKAGCVRGAQLNFLQPIAHLNVYRGKGEPWNWDRETEEIFLKFDRLHYRLLPYWYTCAWQAHRTGMPAWRHLVFTDPAYYDRDQEFMVGEAFYFAPILDDGTSRPVFIPEGRWIDYFTGEIFDGPREIKSYAVPLDRTLLFVRAGAIIPMGPERHYVAEKPLAPLTLDLYPYGCPSSRYVLYEDDGMTTKYLAGDCCTTAIEMHDTGGRTTVTIRARQGEFTPPTRDCELLLHGIGQQPSAVSLNGKPAESAYDDRAGCLRVIFPDTGREQELIVRR